MSEILCLVGSVKQVDEWRSITDALTRRGYVILEAGAYGSVGHNITQKEWDTVTLVHWSKIDLCHRVLVIKKPDGSIGEHTKLDCLYAKQRGKNLYDAKEFVNGIWREIRI